MVKWTDILKFAMSPERLPLVVLGGEKKHVENKPCATGKRRASLPDAIDIITEARIQQKVARLEHDYSLEDDLSGDRALFTDERQRNAHGRGW